MDSLNKRQRLFVKYYLIDLNAREAAKNAGYSHHAAQACRLLADVNISKAIKQEMDKRARKLDITAEMVLMELSKIGFADITNYMKWNDSGVQLKDSDELSNTQTAAVQEVSYHFGENSGNVKLKMHDKISALEKIGKHLGMWKEMPSVNINMPDYDTVLRLNGIKPRKKKDKDDTATTR